MIAPYTFTADEMALSPIGLCAACLAENQDANNPVRVSHTQQAMSKELTGGRVRFPSGNTMEWNYGVQFVPGGVFLAEAAMAFGPGARFEAGPGFPLPVFAVTTFNGTMLCAAHLGMVERSLPGVRR